MGGAMVPANERAFFLSHGKLNRIAYLKHTGNNFSHMPNTSASEVDSIFYLELIFARADHSAICILSTHGSIKWRLFHNDGSVFTVRKRLRQLCLRRQHCNFRAMHETVITNKFWGDFCINLIIDRGVSSHIIRLFPGISRFIPLFFHTGSKARLVNSKTFLF